MSKNPGSFSLAREAQYMRILAMSRIEESPRHVAKRRAVYQEALLELKTAVTLNPEDAEIRENIADVFSALAQDDNALYHYRKALDLAPRSDYARMGVIKVLLDKGASAEAMAYAEKGVELHPRMSRMWHALGICCLGERQYSRASAAFETAEKETTPDDEKLIPGYRKELARRIREAKENIRIQAVAVRFAPRNDRE